MGTVRVITVTAQNASFYTKCFFVVNQSLKQYNYLSRGSNFSCLEQRCSDEGY